MSRLDDVILLLQKRYHEFGNPLGGRVVGARPESIFVDAQNLRLLVRENLGSTFDLKSIQQDLEQRGVLAATSLPGIWQLDLLRCKLYIDKTPPMEVEALKLAEAGLCTQTPQQIRESYSYLKALAKSGTEEQVDAGVANLGLAIDPIIVTVVKKSDEDLLFDWAKSRGLIDAFYLWEVKDVLGWHLARILTAALLLVDNGKAIETESEISERAWRRFAVITQPATVTLNRTKLGRNGFVLAKWIIQDRIEIFDFKLALRCRGVGGQANCIAGLYNLEKEQWVARVAGQNIPTIKQTWKVVHLGVPELDNDQEILSSVVSLLLDHVKMDQEISNTELARATRLPQRVVDRALAVACSNHVLEPVRTIGQFSRPSRGRPPHPRYRRPRSQSVTSLLD